MFCIGIPLDHYFMWIFFYFFYLFFFFLIFFPQAKYDGKIKLFMAPMAQSNAIFIVVLCRTR